MGLRKCSEACHLGLLAFTFGLGCRLPVALLGSCSTFLEGCRRSGQQVDALLASFAQARFESRELS